MICNKLFHVEHFYLEYKFRLKIIIWLKPKALTAFKDNQHIELDELTMGYHAHF